LEDAHTEVVNAAISGAEKIYYLNGLSMSG